MTTRDLNPVEPFRTACLQFDVQRGDVEANLTAAVSLLERAASENCALAVLPEMWTTSFLTEYDAEVLRASDRALDEIRKRSKAFDLLVIGGGPKQSNGRIYNTADVFDRGVQLGSYRKIHLFSPNNEHRHHAAGGEPLVLDTRLGRIGVVICYDIRFPELIRHFFHEGCDVLAVPSQWPEARADHWRSLVKARAIENQLYVVGCNRTGVDESLRKPGESLPFPGDSRIVDPMGAVVAEGAGESGIIAAQVELRRVRAMRRIMPVAKDRRPDVYRRIWMTKDGPLDHPDD